MWSSVSESILVKGTIYRISGVADDTEMSAQQQPSKLAAVKLSN